MLRLSFLTYGVAILLIVVLAGLMVFSPLLMGHAAGQNNHDCLAELISLADCPASGGFLTALNFHLGAAKGPASSFWTVSLGALLLLVTLLVIIGWTVFSESPPRIWARFGLEVAPARVKINRWLALHETSPTVF
ncbi:MAG: hypothetical protein AAB468_01225 [Patescibacteria group bacterium]